MSDTHTENDVMNLLEQLVVISDEFEGQQMLDLSNVDVCATDVDDGNNYAPTDVDENDFNQAITDINDFIDNYDSSNFKKAGNYAIIEFADECEKYPAEEYKLYVKPDDNLTTSTIIGSCIQEEKWKEIKSIFSVGEVMAKEDDPSSFKHLFENHNCNRHIIIKNYEIDSDINIDVSTLEELTNDFNKREEYFQLFKDALNYSVLPTIISQNRNLVDFVNIIGDDRTDLQIFDEWIKHVDKTVENFTSDERIQIKEKAIKKTGGDGNKTKDLANKNIELQKLFIDGNHTWGSCTNGIIDLYSNYSINTRELFKKTSLIQDLTETLTEHLGVDNPLGEAGEGQNNYRDCKNLGVTYYLDLLGRIPSDYEGGVSSKFYELVEDIINNRNKFEQHSIEEIIYWINKTEESEKILPNSFKEDVVTLLDREFKDDVKFADVFKWLVDNKRKKATNEACKRIANVYMYFRKNQTGEKYDYDEIYKKGKEFYFNDYYSSNKERRYKTKYQESLEYVSNKELQSQIESDIKNNGSKYYEFLPEKIENNIDYYKLTMYEKWRLDEFWGNAISEYKQGLALDTLLDKLENCVTNDYAEWPSPVNIQISNEMFSYYFFDNIDAWKKQNTLPDSQDIGTIPADLDKVTLPENPSTLGDIDPNGNDDDIPLGDYGKTHTDFTTYKYWLKYFGIATVCSLPYFAPSGINIAGVPLWLPAVFIPIKPVYIKVLDLLIVIGLSVRGISIQPIFLFVNMSNQDLSALTPVVIALKKVKQIFDDQINKLEKLPAQLAQKYMNKIISDSEKMIRENRELEIQINGLESINFPGMERAKRQIESEIKHVNPRQHNIRKEDLMKLA